MLNRRPLNTSPLNTSGGQALVRAAGDAVGMADTPTRERGLARVASTLLGLADQVGAFRDLLRQDAAALGVREGAASARGLLRLDTRPVGLTEGARYQRGLTRLFGSVLRPVDSRQNWAEASDDLTYTSSGALLLGTTALAAQTTHPLTGQLTAGKLVETAANTFHRVERAWLSTQVPAANTTVTFSAYVKTAERAAGYIEYRNLAGASVRQFFDLTTGTLGTTANGTPLGAALTPVGNGWYRVSITASQGSGAATGTGGRVGLVTAPNGANTYAGSVGAGLYIAGLQLELRDAVGPYVVTHPAATVAATASVDTTRTLVARAVTATLGLPETARRVASLVRRTGSVASLTDQRLTARALGRVAPAALGITEGVGRRRGLARLAASAVGLVEATRRTLALRRLVGESLRLADTTVLVVATVIALVLRVVGSAVGVAETTARRLTLTRQATTLLRVADARLAVRLLLRRVADGLGLTETRRRVLSLVRRTASTFGLPEATRRLGSGVRAAASALGLTETVSRWRALARVAGASLGLREGVARLRGLGRVLGDAVGLADLPRAARVLTRQVADALGLGHTLAWLGARGRVVGERLGLGEVARRLAAITRSQSEMLTLTEFLSTLFLRVGAVLGRVLIRPALTGFARVRAAVSAQVRFPSSTD